MAFNLILPNHIVISGDMSQTTVSSTAITVSYQDNVGIQVTWTGTPTGVIEVDGSNDGTNFYSLTFNPAISQPAGVAGGFLLDINQFPFAYIKLLYTKTSGTGVLDAYLVAKGV